jgi:hypothetical protein
MVNIISESNKHIHEGYLMVDHRASPGLTPEQARTLGYSPQHVGEGQLFETKTNHCCHCGTVVIMNPDRIRERAKCQACNKYICDMCGIAMKEPSYVHKTYKQQLEEGLTYFSNLKET